MRCCSSTKRENAIEDDVVIARGARTRADVDDGASARGVTPKTRSRASERASEDERSTTSETMEYGENDNEWRARRRREGEDVEGGAHGEANANGRARATRGRRSAWDRAGTSDLGSERSASNVGSLRRGKRTISRDVERALGGECDWEEEEEFEPERATRADEELGFGFVSREDVARRERERAKAEANAKIEADRREREAREETVKRKKVDVVEESDEEETTALLTSDHARKRRPGGKKMSLLAYTAIASCAVIAACAGVVIFVPPSTLAPRATAAIAPANGDVVLTSSGGSASTNAIATQLITKMKNVSNTGTGDATDAGEEVVLDARAKSKSSSKSAAIIDDAEQEEYDEEPADENEEDDNVDRASSRRSGSIEAKLGRFAWADEDAPIRASSACAPIHLEMRHGVYRQFNRACLKSDDFNTKPPKGCVQTSTAGCQNCYVEGSPAASQVSSYSWCSRHVCEMYDVSGCEPEHKETTKNPGYKKASDFRSIAAPVPKKTSSSKAVFDDVDDGPETCLPNLEDAKRGIFQYSELYCRSMGHHNVDYSGCVSIGKSSCRMCVTKSTLQSTVFSLCPKSVCENHDLLYHQCADDE